MAHSILEIHIRDLLFDHHSMEGKLQGMLAAFMADTIQIGNEEFIKLTNKILEEFESNPLEYPPFLFSAVVINEDPHGYPSILHRTNEIFITDKQLPSDCDFDLLRATRHRLAWITQQNRKFSCE